MLNLSCALHEELFNQGVHVLLAQLENSLWNMRKDNPFNCLLIIASFSSLRYLAKPLRLRVSWGNRFCQEGCAVHAPWESSWLYSLFCSFCFRLLVWTPAATVSQTHSRVQRGGEHQLPLLFIPSPLRLDMWISWTQKLCQRKETRDNWKWGETQHECAWGRSYQINMVPFFSKIIDLFRQGRHSQFALKSWNKPKKLFLILEKQKF